MRPSLRPILAAVLLLASACPDESATALALSRPDGTGKGAPAGHVVHLAGTARVKPAQGEPFAAKPGTDLLASDVVAPATGGFVVLQLRNKWLVRVDDLGPLRVADILLLSAPPATAPVPQQLAQLLGEDAAAVQSDVATRVAGWESRLRAAETATAASDKAGDAPPPSVQTATESVERVGEELAEAEVRGGLDRKRSKGAGSEKAIAGGGSLAKKGRGATKTKQKRKPEEQGPGRALAGANKDAEQKDAAQKDAAQKNAETQPGDKPSEAPAAPPWLRVQAGAAPDALEVLPTPPAGVVALAGALQKCLANELGGLGLPAQRVTLKLELRGGKVTRAVLDGALPLPACARSALVGATLAGAPADGWLALPVPLTR